MHSRTLATLGACSIALAVALPLRAQTSADLPKLIAEAARYESGQNIEPLQKLEQLLRDSVGKRALRAELEAAMVKLLAEAATFEARRFACQMLAVVGTDASLPALAELLKDDQTVGIACLALSGQQSPKAIELLRNALPSAQGRSRLQILGALGSHRDAQSVAALAQLARDADAAVADAAILALGKIGTAEAHAAILALRKEARPELAGTVTEATLRVAEQRAAAGDRQAASAIYSEMLQPTAPTNLRRGALAALLEMDQDGGQQRILDTIAGGDMVLVPVAIARVAALKSDGASARFAAELPKLPPAAQVWMIGALASRGDAAARSAIRAEVFAADPAVRRAAVAAVSRLEDASAVPLLAKLLSGATSPEELQDVELALGTLRGGAATDEALVAELRRSCADAKVRLFSVLARRGARAAVPALLAEAGGADPAMVRPALQALGKLAAAEDFSPLVEKLVSLKAADARGDAESAVARAMAKVNDVARRSEVLRAALANASDVETRCSLLRLLPKAPDASALAALEAAGKDPQPRIRDAAVRALADWPEASGWDTLLAILRRPENDAHRALALRALVRLAGALNAKPDAALVQRYRQLLDVARGDDELKLILSALAGAAHPDALEPALALLAHAGVRAEAELAVTKIAEAIKAQHPQAAEAALARLKQARP